MVELHSSSAAALRDTIPGAGNTTLQRLFGSDPFDVFAWAAVLFLMTSFWLDLTGWYILAALITLTLATVIGGLLLDRLSDDEALDRSRPVAPKR